MRQRKPKPKENNERWLITYSDLITLLMIFFVVMYAMSSIDKVKFLSLQTSLGTALHESSKIPLGDPALLTTAAGAVSAKNNSSQPTNLSDPTLDNLYKQVKAYIEQNHLQGNVSIENQTRGVQITLRDVALFDTGQATLRPDARTMLAGLLPFLRSLTNPVVIEGYTDDQPIETAQFPSNWELSAGRAVGVVRFFASEGIDPQRLSGVAYGQYHQLVKNDTPEHRQMNRRVNIVILRSDQPVPGAPSAAVSPTIQPFSNTTTP